MDMIQDRLNLQPIEIRKNNIASSSMTPDFVFIVGQNKERVPAYKQILGLSNDAFLNMFNGQYREKTEMEIPEFEPDDFKDFLLYLYFQEIDLTNLNPFNLYSIANKYHVGPLCKKCVAKIGSDISYYNLCSIMEWNQIYDNADLWHSLKSFITKNIVGCLQVNRGFKDLSKESLQRILKWNNIWCFETLLLSHVLLWADDQLHSQKKDKSLKNKKEVLDGILNLIRIKVNDDLTYDEACIESRYMWKVPNFHETFFGLVTKSTASTWINNSRFNKKTVCLGFKMPLSNISSNPQLIEEFTFSYVFEESVVDVETFKIPVRGNVAIRDLYFKKPVVFEAEYPYEFRVLFKNSNNRFVTFMTTFSNISVIAVNLYLFLEKFEHPIHHIYDISKTDVNLNVSLT